MTRPRPDLVSCVRSGLRPLAVLFVVGHLVTLVLTLTHTMHVEHVRCVEHGEMVHAHEAEETGEPVAAAPDARHSVSSDAPLQIEDHGHCAVVSLPDPHRDTLAVPPAAELSVIGHPPAGDALIARQAPAGTVMSTGPPQLTLAPKTSPPTA